MADFLSCCHSLDIFYAPTSGEFFTWTNGSLKENLDKALINQSWHDNNLICQASVQKMECISNHCPIIIEVLDRVKRGNTVQVLQDVA